LLTVFVDIIHDLPISQNIFVGIIIDADFETLMLTAVFMGVLVVFDHLNNACPMNCPFLLSGHEECSPHKVGSIHKFRCIHWHHRWVADLFDLTGIRVKTGKIFHAVWVMSGPDKDSGRRLPIKQVSKAKVGAEGIIGRTDLGSKEDFVGLRVEDFECHSMTTMGRDTNKISKSFRGFTGERGIINSVEHWLVPVKPEKGAYIHSSTKKDRQGNLPV
jgi:hypothetical protein